MKILLRCFTDATNLQFTSSTRCLILPELRNPDEDDKWYIDLHARDSLFSSRSYQGRIHLLLESWRISSAN